MAFADGVGSCGDAAEGDMTAAAWPSAVKAVAAIAPAFIDLFVFTSTALSRPSSITTPTADAVAPIAAVEEASAATAVAATVAAAAAAAEAAAVRRPQRG